MESQNHFINNPIYCLLGMHLHWTRRVTGKSVWYHCVTICHRL